MGHRVVVCFVSAVLLLPSTLAHADDAPVELQLGITQPAPAESSPPTPPPTPPAEAEPPSPTPEPAAPRPTPVLILSAPEPSPNAAGAASPPPVVVAPPNDTHAAAPFRQASIDDRANNEDPPRTALNALSFELLGPGLVYSVNYDRVLSEDFSLRVGISHFELSLFGPSRSYVNVPIIFNYIGIGSVDHIFEIGAGATLLHISRGSGAGELSAVPNLSFGYRFQPFDGGVLFRIGVSLMVVHDDGGWIPFPWPYLALGWTG